MSKKIKVMIVDDSLPFRSILSSVLQGNDQIEVVATAYNGNMALNRIKENNPDVITLDYEMPDMNGLETLKILHEKHPNIGVIMLSAMTTESASITMEAINAGADDFLVKSYDGKSREENIELIKKNLSKKIIRCFDKKHNLRTYVGQLGDDTKEMGPLGGTKKEHVEADLDDNKKKWNLSTKPISLITIGFMQSHIGIFIEEMKKLHLKKGVPIIVYIKMPESFLRSFVENLKPKVNASLKILDDGDTLLPRIIYFVNGYNQNIRFEEGDKIKIHLEKSEKDLSEDAFFKATGVLTKSRMAAFLTAENVFTPGILGLKELKSKDNLTFLLYTKSYKEEDVKLVENSYSQIASSVIIPMKMASTINGLTSAAGSNP
ncbi:MAG: response regulator [Candidatus Aureabacteria bacterium]|nr:response regulator [Candidatus Auribacterota bacterium]